MDPTSTFVGFFLGATTSSSVLVVYVLAYIVRDQDEPE
jgi:hypothetical protein